jgi:hypothetical protein
VLAPEATTRDAFLPERRLMSAVLAFALEEYQKYVAKGWRSHHGFAEVAGWFASDEARWPFSFLSICEALGLDAPSIRAGLRTHHAGAQRVGLRRIRGDLINLNITA